MAAESSFGGLEVPYIISHYKLSFWAAGPPPKARAAAVGGRPPPRGGRPRAKAAASPQGWPPPKHLSPFRRFLIANGIRGFAAG
jgi:hypothetical protein